MSSNGVSRTVYHTPKSRLCRMSIQQLLEEENEGEGISVGANHVATQVGQGPLENKQGTLQEQKQHALISSTNKRYFKKKKGKL